MLDSKDEDPKILEEIEIEELFIDGICGVYSSENPCTFSQVRGGTGEGDGVDKRK